MSSATTPAAQPTTGEKLSQEGPRRIRVQTQFSAGFGDWLIRERVGLVASTYQTGHLLFIGVTAEGKPVPSAAGFAQAMGIAATAAQIARTQPGRERLATPSRPMALQPHFTNYDAILDAWSGLIAEPARIQSLGARLWAICAEG